MSHVPPSSGYSPESSPASSQGSSPPPARRGSPRISPIEKFLGPEAIMCGPLGLLGLTPETCTDERIVSSLEWQLDRVSQHPEGDTPEADEARLGLHAAAAQLLDRNVRRLVLARMDAGGASATDVRVENGSPHPGGTDADLDHDAMVTLAMHGGWNKKSIAHLAALAHARGMTSEELARSLAKLAGKPRKPAARSNISAGRGHRREYSSGSPDQAGVPRAPQARVTTSATGGDAPALQSASSPDPLLPQYQLDRGGVYLRNLVIGIGAVALVFIGMLVFAAILLTDAGKQPTAGKSGAGSGNTSGTSTASSANSTPGTNSANTTPDTSNTGAATKGSPSTSGQNSKNDASNKPSASNQAQQNRPGAKKTSGVGDGEYVDPVLVVRSLRESAAMVKTNYVKALAKFEAGLASLTTRWCRFDPAQRRAADAAVIDFIYASASIPDAYGPALDAVVRGAQWMDATAPAVDAKSSTGSSAPAPAANAAGLSRDRVWPAVWSVGILTRLSRERELPSEISGRVEAALTAAIGADRPRLEATFETGAIAALRRLPARILLSLAAAPAGPADKSVPEKPPGNAPASASPSDSAGANDQPLAEWIEAVGAVCGPDQDQSERILIDGLEQILVESAEPSGDKHVYAAVQQLAVAIKWRKGGPARARMMEWFKDQRLTMQDMQVLTSAIATRSAAEGVDATMVLSVGASVGDRERVRGLYAKVWGESGKVGTAKSSAQWANAARAEIRRTTDLTSSLDLLEATVRLAELSEAATLLWRGETDSAARIVENAGVSADSAKTPTTATLHYSLDTNSEGDGRWLASYLSAGRSIPLRLERLKELENSQSPIGQSDAELLVDLACNESPAEVRAAAQHVVQKHANEPVIVNGLLETLPRAPKYITVSTMIEGVLNQSLPRATDPAWETETRRGLVERLLELLASAGDQAAINGLSALLFESYRVRSGLDTLKLDQVATDTDAQRGSDAAAAMWRLWRDAAEAASPNEYAPFSLGVIDRRREGRVTLASGPIQRFAADQTGTAELTAYVVTGERPAAASAVRLVMSEMAQDRRKAGHIFGQLAAAERAILRLWLVRFQESEQ